MDYPKLPAELDRRKKLTSEDLDRIKELRSYGLTYKEIGEAVGTDASNVGYHLNPATKLRVIERVKREQKYKWENDPEWRKRKLKYGAESKKYIAKVNENIRIYKRQFKRKNCSPLTTKQLN